jgi:hypothetical protein
MTRGEEAPSQGSLEKLGVVESGDGRGRDNRQLVVSPVPRSMIICGGRATGASGQINNDEVEVQ